LRAFTGDKNSCGSELVSFAQEAGVWMLEENANSADVVPPQRFLVTLDGLDAV